MKTNKFSFIIIAICAFAMASCVKSTQSFTVQGKPGTSITTPQGEHIAIIDGTGQAQIKLKRKQGYYPFLLAQEANSTKHVPFALDYKDKKRYKAGNLGTSVSLGTAIVGVGLLIAGAAMAASSSSGKGISGSTWALLGAGAGVGGVSSLSGLYFSKLQSMNYQYDYLPTQQTNNDIVQ